METGIVSYGVALPRHRISAQETWRVWKNMATDLFDKMSIGERAVLGPEEDTLTLAVAAAKTALERSGVEKSRFGALLLGSGTSPYATKSAATVMVDALGLPATMLVTDVQCAEKSGSTALLMAAALVETGQIDVALVVAADTLNRHVSPGMVFEYVASAGAVAFVLGKQDIIASLEAWATHAWDQNDFFRVEGERFIQPGAGFVGWVSSWGMLDHVVPSTQAFFAKTGLKPEDFAKFAVPQRNGIRPLMVMGKAGLEMMQVLPFVLTAQIGDCGAASVPLALAHILDWAEPGERIGVIDYGSGAGCDTWSLVTTDLLAERRPLEGTVMALLDDKIMVDYATMLKYEHKLLRSPNQLSNFY